MTPLPKRRLSTKRQGQKRSTIKLSLTSLFACPNCHKPKAFHRVCPHCGYYAGKLVKNIKTPKDRKSAASK